MKLSSVVLLAAASVASAAPAADPDYEQKMRAIYTPNPEYFPDLEGSRSKHRGRQQTYFKLPANSCQPETGWSQFSDSKLVSISSIQNWWDNLMTVAGPAETQAGD